MKILVIYSEYNTDIPSGGNLSVDNQIDFLRQSGYRVFVYKSSTKYLSLKKRKIWFYIDIFLSYTFGLFDKKELTKIILDNSIEKIIIHNNFPHFGPLLYKFLKKISIFIIHIKFLLNYILLYKI